MNNTITNINDNTMDFEVRKVYVNNKWKRNKMPFTYEIETLTMTPEKWAMLNCATTLDEYRVIVLDYQRREFELLPKCKTLFGLCRYWASGRCTNKNHCRNKEN